MLFLSAPSLTCLPVLRTVADPQKTSSFLRDFPGGPVVKTQPSDAGGMSSIPGQGDKIPTYLTAEKPEYKQQKKCGNKFNKD